MAGYRAARPQVYRLVARPRSLPGSMSNGTSSRSLPHVSERGSGAIRGSIAARYSQDRDADSFSSQLDLLRNAEHVVDLDAEVADGALELRMPDEQLDGSQVAGLLVDLRRLRPTHRMGAVRGAVQPGALDPSLDDPRILACRQVGLRSGAAREEVLVFLVDLRKPVWVDVWVCSVISN